MPSLTLPIEQASARLSKLVQALGPGDEILLTDHDEPVARIVPTDARPSVSSGGSWRGRVEMPDDGDEVILDHFKDYLP